MTNVSKKPYLSLAIRTRVLPRWGGWKSVISEHMTRQVCGFFTWQNPLQELARLGGCGKSGVPSVREVTSGASQSALSGQAADSREQLGTKGCS